MNSGYGRALALLCAGVLLAARLGSSAAAQAPGQLTLERVQEAVDAAGAAHPRLLLDRAGFEQLRERVRQEPRAAELYRVLHAQAEAMLTLPPVQHVVVGRRLLNESRKAVRRLLTLSLVYRLSGDERFLRAATREMLAAAAFPDWNPSHFLDTAEMSFAVAIGYDWLFDQLSAADRAAIKEALYTKGYEASVTKGQCFTETNNWGQVCTAGISAAALAFLEDDRQVAARVVHRAVTGVPNSMKAYTPDGTYPEGPAYWDYGTSFNVILISELESVLGTDFGLSAAEGFDRTAAFINHATGPTGLYFNYADGSSGRPPLPALQWFARRFDRPDWLLTENRLMAEHLRSPAALSVAGSGDRLLPLALVWMPRELPAAENRLGLNWLGTGLIPVAMHRTSWTDPNAVFVGIKAGFAAGPHGQMDAGSFVLDADGERWAHDLGAEDYNRIEERGLDLWNRSQGSDRWRVFRNNNLSHSTLVIGGRYQHVEGKATILRNSDSSDFPSTVVDLSPAYRGQAQRVARGIGILNGAEVLVQDRLEGVTGGPVRWGMVTRAAVEIRGPREAVLRQGGKELTLRVLAPASAELRMFDTETPPAEHDSPNPGTRMVGFLVDAGAAPLDLVVRLTPGSAASGGRGEIPFRPLEAW